MSDDTRPPIEESLFEAPPMAEQERMVEAVLFASAEAVTVAELNARMPHGCDAAEAIAHSSDRLDRIKILDDSYGNVFWEYAGTGTCNNGISNFYGYQAFNIGQLNGVIVLGVPYQ